MVKNKLILCLLTAFVFNVNAANYYVGNNAPPAGGIYAATLNAVPWSTLVPGTKVYVSPGTYTGISTILNAVGTIAAPIVIQASDVHHQPIFKDSIDVQGSSFVQLSYLTVQAPTYEGFLIRNGSNHIFVTDNTVYGGLGGVNVTTGAGTGIQLLRNFISDGTNDGIGIDQINSSANDSSLIAYNTITRMGVHGIEIRGSNYRVQNNIVSNSGTITSGASGIHVYQASANEGHGANNIITYNFSYNNKDVTAYDGNGIQIDHYCNSNTVAYNVVWNNDGAGITIYDGASNTVKNNVAYGNEVDPGHTHTAAAGQIMVSGTNASYVHDNKVSGNIAVSTINGTPAVYVDTRAVSATGNLVGPNIYVNTSAGYLLRWTDSTYKQTLVDINTATGTTGSSITAPLFVDVTHPLFGGLTTKPISANFGISH